MEQPESSSRRLQVPATWPSNYATSWGHNHRQRVRDPIKKSPPPTNKSRRPKILDTKPERQNLNSKAIWAWSERGNLCSRQIMILPGKTKNICNTVGSRALFRIAGTPGNLYCLLLSSLVSITSGIHPSHDYDTEMDSEGLIREFVRFMKLHTWSFR